MAALARTPAADGQPRDRGSKRPVASAGYQRTQIGKEHGGQGFGVLLSEVGKFFHRRGDIARAHGTPVRLDEWAVGLSQQPL